MNAGEGCGHRLGGMAQVAMKAATSPEVAGSYLKSSIQSRADLLGIENGAAADLVVGEVAPRLPFPEGHQRGAGVWIGEQEGQASLGAHERREVAIVGNVVDHPSD